MERGGGPCRAPASAPAEGSVPGSLDEKPVTQRRPPFNFHFPRFTTARFVIGAGLIINNSI